jgi:membrane protein implicated in regulation of membrane protease activity
MNAMIGLSIIGAGLAAAIPSFASAYVLCLIVGGGLVLISTVFGGHGDNADFDGADLGGAEADFGVDADIATDVALDADADIGIDGGDFDGGDLDGVSDAHVDGAGYAGSLSGGHDHAAGGASSLSNWFSIRFLVYFAAAFGLVGTVLTYMTSLTSGVVLLSAVGSGLVVGQGVHQLIRALQRSSSDSSPTMTDFVDQVGRITVAVRPLRSGEVAVRVGDREFFLPASAKRPDDEFATGDRVVITSYTGGTAEVVSQQEYEFLTQR